MNTPEQDALRAELIKRYGERAFEIALEMSGVRNCLQALACDELTKEERAEAYTRAGMHVARWQATYMTTSESAALTECASLIDGAVTLWALDDLEQREGLPPCN